MSFKASVSAGHQLLCHRVSWRSGDLSARYPGGLGREGGTPGASWRQWVPRNCSLEGPQRGVVRTTCSGGPPARGSTSRMGPKRRLGREAGGEEGQGAPPKCPSTHPRPNPGCAVQSCREANAASASQGPPGGHCARGQVAMWVQKRAVSSSCVQKLDSEWGPRCRAGREPQPRERRGRLCSCGDRARGRRPAGPGLWCGRPFATAWQPGSQ